jgi:hypothetical protein
MITPFTLHYTILVAQLQKQYVSLCPVEALTRPSVPLLAAFGSLFALDDTRSLTFVLDEQRRDGQRLQGFIQVDLPAGRPEAHIKCLAPQLDADGESHKEIRTIWNRLLSRAVSASGERGLQRVFACAPDGQGILGVLLSAGFMVYTREEILALAPDAHPQAVAQQGIRPEQSVDAWPISQLYRQVTPHLVRQAEMLTDSGEHRGGFGPIAWERGEGFVLKEQETITGYGHLMPGRTGHWLSILIQPQQYDRVDKLLDYGLALLNYYPPRPVYCSVREYQGGLRVPLIERGFEPISLQCRLVKHTTAWAKEPARNLVPALEQRAKAPTPTASQTEN